MPSSETEVAWPALPREGFSPTAPYTPHYSDGQIPPPYEFQDVQFAAFKLQAERSRLEGMCKTLLNWDTSRDCPYRVATDTVILELMEYGSPRPSPRASGRFRIGDGRYHMLIVRALVAKTTADELDPAAADALEPEAFSLLAFTDDPWALLSQREVVGCPAFFARFVRSIPKSGIERTSVRVGETLVDGESEPPAGELFRIEHEPWSDTDPARGRAPASHSPRSVAWLWSADDFRDDDRFVDRVVRGQAQNGATRFRTVQFKQIRDAIEPQLACHQELVEGECEVQRLAIASPGAAAQIEFGTYSGLNVGAELGLPEHRALVAANRWCLGKCDVTSRICDPRKSEPPRSRVVRKRAKFIGSDDDPQISPPYQFRDVTIKGFKLPADLDRLNAVCDELLNFEPRQGFKYRAASADVILEVLEYGSMQAEAPPTKGHRPSDSTRQCELIFRIFVGRVEEASTHATDPRVFCPYIFVDNPLSMIIGRQVIGYPKLLAAFSPATGLDAATAIDVTPVGWMPAGSRGPLVHILLPHPDAATPRIRVPPEVLLPSLEQGALPWDQEDLSEPEFRRQFAKNWMELRAHGFGTIQLKVIRDAVKHDLACHKELVEGSYRLTHFELGFPSGMAQIQIAREPRLDICDRLGLSSEIWVSSGSWYEAKCDFDLGVVDPLAAPEPS